MTAWKDLKAKTVYILFFSEDELITRTKMRIINFREKILHGLPVPVEFETYTDKEFIQKMWRACLRHGYVYKCDDILETYLDKIQIIIT